jgi:hypothetical protein
MYRDILAAVREHKRYLHRMSGPLVADLRAPETRVRGGPPLFTKPRQVEAMLRVEIARGREADLWDSMQGHATEALSFSDHRAGRAEGPWTIEGVAVYTVGSLPGQGWRVINPMRMGR